MTFGQLTIGAAFRFTGKDDRERLSDDRLRSLVHRVKTGDRTYDVVWVDGAVTRGRVGVGDNAVECLS